MPQFNTATFISQLFWLAISFGMVVFCFARIFIPRFNATLEKRFLTIRNDIEQAEHMQMEANTLFAKRHDRLEEARKEADTMIKTALISLDAKREEQMAIVQNEMQHRLKIIEQSHEEQLTALHERLVPIADACVHSIVERLSLNHTGEVKKEKRAKGKGESHASN